MCNIKLNALNAIARKCNDEIRPIDKKDLASIRKVMDRYAEQAILLGFTKTRMMIEIGRINGVLVDRS